jgi:AcrR family transcriptional regulator
MVRGAYRVMARVGAQQLSLRQVAKEVGVSAALFIYHFGSKDNLLLETMRWALAGTVRRIEERLAGIDDPRRALKALLDAVFVDANANRDFHLIYLDLVQYAVRNPSFGGLTELLREHINGSYAFVIRMGVRAGTFQVTDVELAAARSRALIEGRFIQWLQEPDWQQTYGSLRQEAYTELLNLLDG